MTPELTLHQIAHALTRRGRRFALVGGLAVSLRAEVRFTRDVDIAVPVRDDRDTERLVVDLQSDGFLQLAVVDDERRGRIAISRLRSRSGVVVDLLMASSGIEAGSGSNRPIAACDGYSRARPSGRPAAPLGPPCPGL